MCSFAGIDVRILPPAGKAFERLGARAHHLLVTPHGDPSGFVDEALARHGFTRRIALTVNHFTVVPAIIAERDRITTMPKRIAELCAPLYGLKLRPSPVATPANYAHIQLLWHKRLGQHAAYNWFRELLFGIVARQRGKA